MLRAYTGSLYGPGRVGDAERAKFHPGDVVRVDFDADAGTLAFAVNGVSQGVCFSGISGKTLHPAIAMYGGQNKSVSLVSCGALPGPHA